MIKCSVSSISIILLTTILWNIWNVSLFVHAIYTYNAISKRKKKHFQSSVLSLIRCVWMGGSLNVVRECYYYYWQSFWCIQFIYRILKYFPTFYNSVLLYLLSWVGFVSFIYFFFFCWWTFFMNSMDYSLGVLQRYFVDIFDFWHQLSSDWIND